MSGEEFNNLLSATLKSINSNITDLREDIRFLQSQSNTLQTHIGDLKTDTSKLTRDFTTKKEFDTLESKVDKNTNWISNFKGKLVIVYGLVVMLMSMIKPYLIKLFGIYHG